MPLSILLVLAHTTLAADYLAAWDYDDYRPDESMVGVDGWVGGYAPDRWLGYRSESSGNHYVAPSTDDPGQGYSGT